MFPGKSMLATIGLVYYVPSFPFTLKFQFSVFGGFHASIIPNLRNTAAAHGGPKAFCQYVK